MEIATEKIVYDTDLTQYSKDSLIAYLNSVIIILNYEQDSIKIVDIINSFSFFLEKSNSCKNYLINNFYLFKKQLTRYFSTRDFIEL